MRSLRRQVLREIRAAGCTCTPTIIFLDRHQLAATGPFGVSHGADVVHEAGCRLGDDVAVLNALGVLPGLMSDGRRCSR